MRTNNGGGRLDVCKELLGVIEEQKNIISKQNEAISKMAIDGMEKENMINALLEDCGGLY